MFVWNLNHELKFFLWIFAINELLYVSHTVDYVLQ